VESRKDELIAKIRERRARLDRTMATIDDRIAVIREVKDRAVKIGRLTAIVVAVTTVTLASVLLVRALTRPRDRGRWLSRR
jgi:phosphopantetheine adenylyltransferase